MHHSLSFVNLIRNILIRVRLSLCLLFPKVKIIITKNSLSDPQMSFNPLPFQENLDYFCFLIFLFFCTVCGLFVRFNVPETKNRTALEIATEFQKIHCKSQTKDLAANELKEIKTCETKF